MAIFQEFLLELVFTKSIKNSQNLRNINCAKVYSINIGASFNIIALLTQFQDFLSFTRFVNISNNFFLEILKIFHFLLDLEKMALLFDLFLTF